MPTSTDSIASSVMFKRSTRRSCASRLTGGFATRLCPWRRRNVRRVIEFTLSMLISTSCWADSTAEVIHPLGLSKEDLKSVWHDGRCDPDWSIKLDQEVVKDRDLLAYKALESGFFEREDAGEMVILRSGEKCDALNKYYFQGIPGDVIDDFIERDKGFTKKYGFSVLDAIYIERAQFYNWNGRVSQFQLLYMKELVRKDLFTLEQKESTFNGEPSIAYSGERTSVGDEFHDKVFP